MPKKQASGQHEQAPVAWMWGTFCRQMLVDPSKQNDFTLVGVFNSIDVPMNRPAKGNTVEAPMLLWFHATFRYSQKVKTNKKFKLTARIAQDGRKPLIQELDVTQSPNHEFLDMNLQIPLLGKGERLILKEGANSLKISFRYKATDLGMVELPIKAIFLDPEKDEGHERSVRNDI